MIPSSKDISTTGILTSNPGKGAKSMSGSEQISI